MTQYLTAGSHNSSGAVSDESFDGCEVAVLAATGRTDPVGSNRGGDDEGFRIVDRKGLEGLVRTLHDSLLALHQVEDVYAAEALATCVMRDGGTEPMAPGLDEFRLM
jgi:hypothetical protein